MPPITRSMTMGKTQEEGVEKGEGSSSPKPEGDLLSRLSQMMADLRADLRRDLKQDIQEEVGSSEGRTRTIQNTLFEEITALKEERGTRPPTPRSNAIPNQAPEELVEEEAYKGWEGGNVRDRVNHLENGRFERDNGANRRFGGGNGGHGRIGVGNQHGGIEPYGDRFRKDRYYEKEPPHKSYGEYMGNEYGMNAEGGYWNYR